MRKRLLPHFVILTVFFSLSLVPSFAAQVVTKDTREWAKQALEKEKSLQAIEAGNTLAVVNFTNKTGQKELMPLEKGLALMLTTDFLKIKSLQVVERVTMQALVEELGLGTSGMVAPDNAPRVGRLLQAHWLVGGDIAGDKVQLKVHSSVLDVPSPRIAGQPTAEGKLAELFAMEKTLLFQIIKVLGIKVTPDEEEALKKPLSTNIEALLALFAATDAADEQQYDVAGRSYEQALKLDPGLLIARDGLRELQRLKLYMEKPPMTRNLLDSLRDRTSVTHSPRPENDATKRDRPSDEGPIIGVTPTGINIIFPNP